MIKRDAIQTLAISTRHYRETIYNDLQVSKQQSKPVFGQNMWISWIECTNWLKDNKLRNIAQMIFATLWLFVNA